MPLDFKPNIVRLFDFSEQAQADLTAIYQSKLKDKGEELAEYYLKFLYDDFKKLSRNQEGRNYEHVLAHLKAHTSLHYMIYFKRALFGIRIMRVLEKSYVVTAEDFEDYGLLFAP